MATTSKATKNNHYWTLFGDVGFPDRVNAYEDDRLLSTAEAAVFLDVSPATLERWATTNEDLKTAHHWWSFMPVYSKILALTMYSIPMIRASFFSES